MRDDLALLCEEVLAARARAAAQAEDRARRDRELREDVAGQTQRLAQLADLLGSAAAEVRDEMQVLSREHAELDAERKEIVARLHEDLAVEARKRVEHKSRIEKWTQEVAGQAAGVQSERENNVAELRVEVFQAMEEQADQENAALGQGVKFVGEVNGALQAEGRERAARDVEVEASASSLDEGVEALSAKLEVIEALLGTEERTRREEKESEWCELTDICERLTFAHQRAESMRSRAGWSACPGLSVSSAISGVQHKDIDFHELSTRPPSGTASVAHSIGSAQSVPMQGVGAAAERSVSYRRSFSASTRSSVAAAVQSPVRAHAVPRVVPPASTGQMPAQQWSGSLARRPSEYHTHAATTLL